MREQRKTPRPADDPLDELRLWNKEREEELIGAVLYKPEVFRDVRAVVKIADFHGYQAKTIFAAMCAIDDRGKVPDALSVAEEVDKKSDVTKADVLLLHGGRMFLSHERTVEFAGEVAAAAARRRLLHAMDEAKALVIAGDLSEAVSLLYGAMDLTADARPAEHDHFEAVLADLCTDLMRDESVPMPIGFGTIDQKFGGVARGELVLVGARTSVGKTAFATSVAVTGARLWKRRVSFFSLEMDRLGIAMRFLGPLAGIATTSLRQHALTDEEMAAFADATQAALPICTDDRARSLAQIRARAHQHKRILGGLDLIVVDYLQLIEVDRRRDERRQEELGRISRGLKRLAKDLNVIVVALCQLARKADERAEEPPRLSDLRESGDLEQDADHVWFLWRPPKSRDSAVGRTVRFINAKNRQGPTGSVGLRFDSARMRFFEPTEEDDE